MLPLADRVAIVTGAGRGIGAATAHRLACAGACVVLAGRDRPSLEQVASEIAGLGGIAHPVFVDVTDPTSVTALACQAVDRHGRLDILVNNAGVAAIGDVRDFSLTDWDRVMNVNARGVFLCSQAALPAMEAQGSGHIINIASVAARVGFPGWAAYCASKAAVMGFSAALREEVRSRGIRVSVIYPGATASPLWDTLATSMDRARMLAAQDVAEAVAYIAMQPAGVLVEDLSLGYPLGNQ